MAGWKALMMATRAGLAEMAELLLDSGADVNAKDAFGFTALQTSHKMRFKRIEDLLRAKGAKE
jgi:ankyrin repeat protein